MTQVTVIKIGGAATEAPGAIASLAATCSQTPGQVIIVHGGGPQLDSALSALGPVQRIGGLRVTTPTAASAMAQVFDAIGARIVEGLLAAGVDAVHVPASGGAILGKPMADPLLGRVGIPVGVGPLPRAKVVVLGPLGQDDEGPLNINADAAAQAVAVAVGAEALILATDVPFVKGIDGAAVDTVDAAGAHRLIQSGAAVGGMVPKLRAAADAVGHGIGRVLIGDLSSVQEGGATTVTGAVAA